MTYDLRREPWIPWRRKSGRVEWGPPAMLVDGLPDGDPVVGIAAPRPDFGGALQEFLIGLLSAALAPADDAEWRDIRREPPSVDALQARLDALPDAFDLEGDGPRFFQDRTAVDFAGTSVAPVEQLFIDTPGEQTTRLNKDLFVKRNRVERLGRPAAAMALLTLQTYAPAGGQGHRTSLRGGGPLTTLVDPRVDGAGKPDPTRPLWEKLWANVETGRQQRERTLPGAPSEIEAAFPWLRPTRTSNPREGGRPTHAAEAHPLEAYFGLPRRIRLEFDEAGVCGITGEPDERTVVGFRMRNYGAQYADWMHPLTPHYRQKPGEPWLPVHGQPGGVGWRDWLGLALEAPEQGTRRPAAAVSAFYDRSGAADSARLHVFGYDMDNMKARGWTEAPLPLFTVDDAPRRERMYLTASRLVDGTGEAAKLLWFAVKRVYFHNPKEAPGDIGHLRTELWTATEAAFYTVMEALAALSPDGEAAVDAATDARTGFVRLLRLRALEVFDRWCPADAVKPDALRRRVAARHDLVQALTGYSKAGEKIFTALAVPLPDGGFAARVAQKRSRKEVST